MKMHFVALVLIVNAIFACNVCGGAAHGREKRSPDKYDDNYDSFLKSHFGHADEHYLDKTAEYKQAQEERDDDESNEKASSSQADEGDSGDSGDSYDYSSKSASVDPDHSWFYTGKDDYERIKALSEHQVAELVKKPGNCKHYEKDGMVCATCEDPETGDNSESCAYSSLPNDKKVAYLTKKSHNFKKAKPFESEEPESHDAEAEEEEESASSPVSSGPKPLKNKSESEDADYGAYKLAGSNHDVEDYDEPKLANLKQLPKNYENIAKEFEIIPESKFEAKNLNQALSEFKTKDWSRCSKLMKGDMTCYYCKDEKNAVQEECMFVSASNPKNFKVERSESKNYDHSKKPTATTKKPISFSKKPIVVAPSKLEAITADPEAEKKQRFARMRIGRPLIPTRTSIKSTAEPLVTPTNLNPISNGDFQNSANKRTIKRTVSFHMNHKDSDPFQPSESRAIHFESHIRHFEPDFE